GPDTRPVFSDRHGDRGWVHGAACALALAATALVSRPDDAVGAADLRYRPLSPVDGPPRSLAARLAGRARRLPAGAGRELEARGLARRPGHGDGGRRPRLAEAAGGGGIEPRLARDRRVPG